MKLAHFLGLGLLLGPLGLAAQTAISAGASFGIAQMDETGADGHAATTPVPLRNLCPVGLRAQHLADGNMVKTGNGHPKGPGQRLHLTLTSPDARTLVSATFNVRGWTAARAHMEQTGAAHGPALAVRTLQAPLTAGTGRSASADLWAPGLTAVESVELLAVSYADGSTWTPAAGNSCRITPDPLMLIAQ